MGFCLSEENSLRVICCLVGESQRDESSAICTAPTLWRGRNHRGAEGWGRTPSVSWGLGEVSVALMCLGGEGQHACKS